MADAPETFVAAPVEEIVTVLVEPTARFEYAAFLGCEAGRPVASGWAAGFVKENLKHMFVLPRVPPSWRRGGRGSQMIERLEAHARQDRRSVLDVQSRWASEFGPSGARAPTVEFAGKHRFEIGLVGMIRRPDLPLSAQRAAQVADALAAGPPGYSIRSWIGPVPDDLLADWAVLEAAVSSEAPAGELDLDAQIASPEAVRDDERILRASGKISVGAGALDEAGEGCGLYRDGHSAREC